MRMLCGSCGYRWEYSSRNNVKRKYIVCPVCRANLKNPLWEQKPVKNNSLSEIKGAIRPILLRYHVKKALIFGSFARREQHEDSDLDILVQFDYSKMDGLDYMRLWKELDEKLRLKVDLVSWAYVNPLVKENAEKEGISAL